MSICSQRMKNFTVPNRKCFRVIQLIVVYKTVNFLHKVPEFNLKQIGKQQNICFDNYQK